MKTQLQTTKTYAFCVNGKPYITVTTTPQNLVSEFDRWKKLFLSSVPNKVLYSPQYHPPILTYRHVA